MKTWLDRTPPHLAPCKDWYRCSPKKSDLKSRSRFPYHDTMHTSHLRAGERIKPKSPGKVCAEHMQKYGHMNNVPKAIFEAHIAHERAKVGIKKRAASITAHARIVQKFLLNTTY